MSKNGLFPLCVLLSAMTLIKFAEPLGAAESKANAGPATSVVSASPKKTSKATETEYEEEDEPTPPPSPRSLLELVRHCEVKPSRSQSPGSSQSPSMSQAQCRREALCSKGKECLFEFGGSLEGIDLRNERGLIVKARGAMKDQANFIVLPRGWFANEELAITMPGYGPLSFKRSDPRIEPKTNPQGLDANRTSSPKERIPFEFKFRGKTYEADSLAIVGPLFDFEVRDGYLELPNFAMHDWFAKNFKPDEFRVILWGAYYPRLAASEIWPYRDISNYEWSEGEDREEVIGGIEDFYLGRPWLSTINRWPHTNESPEIEEFYNDGWWARRKFTPEELPAVEAYFIKLKKEKKFCQVTLKPGTVIRADGAFQTKDPEHIKILKLPKKGLPPLVWCPEDKKGCKCKWEQPPAESYGIPTGEIHHAHGEPITIPKTANIRNWPN